MKQSQIEIPPRPHGGKRIGAGRKPKALRYATEIAAAEKKIVLAMPEIIDSLILCAKGGDSGAGKYLMDRIMGRPPEAAAAPPAENTDIPYDEAAYQRQLASDKRMAELLEEINF